MAVEGRTTAEIVLVRHGETGWSRAGRHTGRTDVPLTGRGRLEARAVGAALAGREFALVLTSPAQRAVETCRLAGLGGVAQVRPELSEWDYGVYEGRTTAEIREEQPGWSIWDTAVPDGESLARVGARADLVIAELRAAGGDAAVFSHAHFLRILTARWLGLEPHAGSLFVLDPATVGVLGHEHGRPALRAWNALCVPEERGRSAFAETGKVL